MSNDDDREGNLGEGHGSNLEEMLTKLLRLGADQPSRSRFKAPKYDGVSNLEVFINQFRDVTTANRWTEQEAVIHLRSSLEGEATDCSDGTNVEEIIDHLRTRFGLTARQARSKLGSLRLGSKQSLHSLGSEITRLVKIAYSQQDQIFQTEMGLETFSRALTQKSVQQHLLARPPQTMSEAIRTTEEFQRLSGVEHSLKVIDTPASVTETSPAIHGLLKNMQGMIQAQTELINKIIQAPNRVVSEGYAPSTNPRRPLGPCYGCGGPHLRRSCPVGTGSRVEDQITSAPPTAGNAGGPAQY